MNNKKVPAGVILLALTGTMMYGASNHRVHIRAKAHIGGKAEVVALADGSGGTVTLGTSVDWSADVQNPDGDVFWYQYQVTGPDGVQRMVRDFGPDPGLTWTTINGEGSYQMTLTALSLTTGQSYSDSETFQFEALATNKALVTPTIQPSVLIYSAPACPAGSTITVQYLGPSGRQEETPAKACSTNSMNFYVGGLLMQSSYQLWHVVTDINGVAITSSPVTGNTGSSTYQFAPFELVTPSPSASPKGVIVYSSLFQPTVATDLAGNIVWYYLGAITSLARPDGSGHFWGFAENPALGPAYQILRKFDLAGNTVLETNAGQVSNQLVAMGLPSITSFHHEARALPDGTILTLGSVEQILTDVQGAGPVDVIGDMILVLDQNLQVVWAWNSFDHLDVTRQAVLGETCGPAAAGCPPFYLASTANDWTHGNALQLTPDGNILYSIRHQDWVVKIDYENGAGNGQILWRMGNGGDFAINSSDPSPWFSHQHDPNFDVLDPTMLYVFDNGNTRQAADPSAHSRGQAYKIDELAMTATPVLNQDLGDFSLALGTAQRLANGNYNFDMGWIQQGPVQLGRVLELDPSGTVVFEIQAPTPFYRAVRLANIYAPESR